MKILSLQSGSNGNSLYVEAGNARLLFDAGISGKQAEQRLAEHGHDIRDVDALLISHDHRDHARCMGIYQRKFGLPIHVTERTLSAASAKDSLGKMDEIQHFRAGDQLRFDGVHIETVPTPHDGEDGAVFIVDDGQHRLGILTDLGHVFNGLRDLIATLDAVFIESNYDPKMLANGFYPERLQQRITGDGGHLSNAEAAVLLQDSASDKLRWVCLAHLSEDNNTPHLALATHRKIFGEQIPLVVASRYQATPLPAL